MKLFAFSAVSHTDGILLRCVFIYATLAIDNAKLFYNQCNKRLDSMIGRVPLLSFTERALELLVPIPVVE